MKNIIRCLMTTVLLLPSTLFAQTGIITGKVTEDGSGNPIASVTVLVRSVNDNAIIKGVFTDAGGQYRIEDLAPGGYRLSFRLLGYTPALDKSVELAQGSTVTFDIALEPSLIPLDEIVVSASRKPEKAIDAPVSVTVIQRMQISERPALAPSDHVRGIAGVDIQQTGLVQQSVVTRGFNNVFSGSLTMLTDNRIAAVPSLRVNVPYFIPLVNDDIERIEVVRGPGSALYGPNASNGVLNIITRSPFASKGTSVSVTGGERSLFQGTFRHAGVIEENIGFKISGSYFRGDDWPYIDPFEATKRADALKEGALEDTLRIGKREPLVERFGGEARFDFHLTSDLAANATIGLNQARRSIELTDIGAAQARNWRYTYYQGRITYSDLFLQAFLNQSDAGETYLLRSGERVVDRSKQFVAQAQHAYSFGRTERLTYGADLLLTRPATDGTITGRNEKSDNVNEYGGYLQSETSLFQDKVNLVLAGRVDKHSELNDLIFSPRAAVVYEPWKNQNFRVTFNRAYNTPTTNELFLDLLSEPNVFDLPPENAVDIRASGVPTTGFNFRRDENGRPFFHCTFCPDRSTPIPVDSAALLWPVPGIPPPTPSDVRAVMANLNVETGAFDVVAGPVDIGPLKPTITETIEIGYKGIIAQKFQAAVDIYYSKVTDFMGPFQIFTPNVFLHPGDLTAYLQPYLGDSLASVTAAAISRIPLGTVTPEEAADPTAILLAPRNYGKVNVAGMDLSLQYQLSDQVSVAGTYSYVNRNFFENLDGIADLALNAPRHKGSITLKYRSPELGLSTELRNRWTDGFRMSSGVYVGTLHSYSLIDASVNYAIPNFTGASITLSAVNLLDEKHQEFIGAPAIGRLVMGRVQYTF